MLKKIVVLSITLFSFLTFSYATCNISNYLDGINYDKVYDIVHSNNSFAFRIKSNGKYYVIKDGIKSSAYSSISKLIYSPTGDIFLYKIRKDNGKYTLVVNGKEVNGDFDRIYDIYFSPDGKSYAFIAKNDGKDIVVFNGDIVSDFDYVSYITFTPDSKDVIIYYVEEKLSYIYYKGEKYGDGTNVLGVGFNNGDIKLLTKKDNIYYINGIKLNGEVKDVVYSRYRNSFAVIVKGENGMYVIKDGFNHTMFDNINSLKFIDNNLVYKASKNFLWGLVVNGIIKKFYDNVYLPIFSKSGDFVYVAERNGKEILIKNDKEEGIYEHIVTYSMCQNGKLVYMVNNTLYINGKKNGVFEKVTNLNFLGNGELWFLYVDGGKNYIYVGGKKYGPYDHLTSLVSGFSKIGYNVDGEIYENGNYIGDFSKINDMFYIGDNLIIYGSQDSILGLYNINCSSYSNYIDVNLKNKYKSLIIDKFGNRIYKIKYSKRVKIVPEVDLIISKIINNPNYNKETKTRKTSLFVAFKEVLLTEK